jgi:hypothetical protein
MALLQTKTGSAGGYSNTNVQALASNVTAGSLLVMGITAGSADGVVSVTDTMGNTWTLVTSIASADRKTWLYYAKNAAAGATTITITFTASTFPDSVATIREYSGMNTTAPLDVSATGNSGTSYVTTLTSSATAATAQASELIIAVGGVSANTPGYSLGTGFGNLVSQNGFDLYTSGFMEDKTVSATGTQTAAINMTSSVRTEIIVAAFKIAAPSSAVTGVTISKGATELLVYWNDTLANGATSYTVKRSTTSGGAQTTVGTPTVPFYKDTGLTNGTTYFYKVYATNGAGSSAASTEVSLAPAARPTAKDQWYNYGTPPSGITLATVRTYMRSHYDSWVTLCFTQTGTNQAGIGAWRVQVPDQAEFNPGGTTAGGTFSEGIGYGMYVTAFLSNWNTPSYDIYAKMYFDGFWRYYNYYKDSNGLMNWKINPDGTVFGTGGAFDGDADVAVGLEIMHLINGSAGTFNYHSLAVTLMNAIRDFSIVTLTYGTVGHRNYIINGDAWGESTDRYMPDYFCPAWMRIFKRATGESRWDDIINANYPLATTYFYNAYTHGLVPDNCTRAGASVSGQSYKYGYNSVRMAWRLTTDWLWNGNNVAYNQVHRLASDSNTRASGVAASTKAEPALDYATDGGYINSLFVSTYGLGGVSNTDTAAWAKTCIDYVHTNALTENAYFGKSLCMMFLLVMSGEMQNYGHAPVNSLMFNSL